MNTSSFVILCLALIASVQAQQRCPLSAQDVSSLNFSQVAAGCSGLANPPSASACDSCGAALFKAFAPAYPKFGLTCDNFPTDPNAANAALTNAISPCINVILPSLNAAKVPVAQLLSLRSCPQSTGPLLTAAAREACPNLRSV